MSIPLKHWYRLGKRTFWLFILNSSRFFILLFILVVYFTYRVVWGSWATPFKEFFISHSNWYLSSNFVLEIIWLMILGYLIVVVLRGWILYRQYKFMLDEHAFYVRRGVFFIKEIVIPYHQIQNVEIKRPYLYRFVGLAQLDTTTLGGVSNTVNKKNLLPIIDHHLAKALAHELVHRGSSSKQDPMIVDEDQTSKVNKTI